MDIFLVSGNIKSNTSLKENKNTAAEYTVVYHPNYSTADGTIYQ
jgi:hypothetical protein